MRRHQRLWVAFVAFVATSTIILAAPDQERPATTSEPNKVRVVNAGRPDAIPVSVQEVVLRPDAVSAPLKVDVTGKPTVVIDAATLVRVKVEPETWEYKQVRVSDYESAAALLNAEGAHGWETTGVMFSAPGAAVVVLKRKKSS